VSEESSATVAARDYWLVPLATEAMPETAAQLLAAGHDSQALRDVAGMMPSADPRDVRDTFVRALREMGVWMADRATAEEDLAVELASDVLGDRVTLEETIRRVREVWDFDDVIYRDPAHSDAWRIFVFIGWLHGGGGIPAQRRRSAIPICRPGTSKLSGGGASP
jgi:hypothetical protein